MSNQKNISRYCESEGGEEKAREKRREEGKEEGRHRGGSLQDGAEEKKSLPRCRGDIAERKKNFSEKWAGPILHWEFARGPKVRESGKNLWGGKEPLTETILPELLEIMPRMKPRSGKCGLGGTANLTLLERRWSLVLKNDLRNKMEKKEIQGKVEDIHGAQKFFFWKNWV